jgi:hypothetical protein
LEKAASETETLGPLRPGVRCKFRLARGADEDGETKTRLTMSKKMKIFDVVFHVPKQRTIRVRATDEDDARDIAISFFKFGTTARKPDKRRRVVYEWRSHEGAAPVTRKRGVSSRDPQGNKNV